MIATRTPMIDPNIAKYLMHVHSVKTNEQEIINRSRTKKTTVNDRNKELCFF